MKNPLLHFLFIASLAFSLLPGISRAAPDADGYVAIQVPDVTQAVSFFRDVMNCTVISDDSQAPLAQGALMSCGRETVVEVSRSSGRPPLHQNTLSLDTDDGLSVVGWLRAHHIATTGSPTHLADGKVAVNFVTPWGQPLQLVGRMATDDLVPSTASAARLASQ